MVSQTAGKQAVTAVSHLDSIKQRAIPSTSVFFAIRRQNKHYFPSPFSPDVISSTIFSTALKTILSLVPSNRQTSRTILSNL